MSGAKWRMENGFIEYGMPAIGCVARGEALRPRGSSRIQVFNILYNPSKIFRVNHDLDEFSVYNELQNVEGQCQAIVPKWLGTAIPRLGGSCLVFSGRSLRVLSITHLFNDAIYHPT